MKLLALFFLSCTALGQVVNGGSQSINGNLAQSGAVLPAPVISNVDFSHVSNTTIPVSFTTNTTGLPAMGCGTSPGVFTTFLSVDSNVGTGVSHVQGVGGLTQSTTYFCQISFTNPSGTATSQFSTTTTATPATAAITGLVLGSSTTYNSINVNNQGSGDTFYNCKSNDSNTYMASDDNRGFTLSGVPAWNPGSGGSQNLMKVTNESPLVIQTIQPFSKYGDTGTVEMDNNASRDTGVFCMQGRLFVNTGRQGNGVAGVAHMYSGNVIWSGDHGQTFNNPQNISGFSTSPAAPLGFSMFPGSPSTMGACAFIQYPTADDGTLGYFLAANQHDNGNLWVYLVCTADSWNGGGSAGGGDVLYLARVARAKIANLSGADYQWWTSGSCNADSSWSSTESSAQPIITDAGKLGQPYVGFVAAKNRYLLLTFSYPSGQNPPGGNTLNSEWDGWESPTPCGAWTKIYTQNFTGAHGGAYNPQILADTLFSGTTPTVLWTGNFPSPDYTMFFATLTIN